MSKTKNIEQAEEILKSQLFKLKERLRETDKASVKAAEIKREIQKLKSAKS